MATRDELYAKFGITAEAGQLLETDLVTIMLGIEGINNGWHAQPDGARAAELLARLDGNTLGQSLKQLRGTIEVDQETADFFSAALKARNRLCHGFYEKHNFKIQTDEGRDLMIADLEEIHDVLFRAWRVASDLSDVVIDILKKLRDLGRGDSSDDAPALPQITLRVVLRVAEDSEN